MDSEARIANWVYFKARWQGLRFAGINLPLGECPGPHLAPNALGSMSYGELKKGPDFLARKSHVW